MAPARLAEIDDLLLPPWLDTDTVRSHVRAGCGGHSTGTSQRVARREHCKYLLTRRGTRAAAIRATPRRVFPPPFLGLIRCGRLAMVRDVSSSCCFVVERIRCLGRAGRPARS